MHRFISRENFIVGAPKYAIVGVFHYSPTMTPAHSSIRYG
jgi:hypothetical protein